MILQMSRSVSIIPRKGTGAQEAADGEEDASPATPVDMFDMKEAYCKSHELMLNTFMLYLDLNRNKRTNS